MASEGNSTTDIPELAPFDPSKKKKKKKIVNQEFDAENVEPLTDKMDNMTVSDGNGSFAGLKKKKKKPVDANLLDGDSTERVKENEGDIEEEEESNESGELQLPQHPREVSNRDYIYEELLGRVFNILREHNPALAGDRRRTVMRPPQVLREGTKKTVFANFTDLCKMMHREPDHVMSFLLSELGTTGSLDGQQRLVIKGRFAPKNFEGLLRRYANEYVICNGCKSSDTILVKENRLFFLRCEQCGSARSVSNLQKVFFARVGRRNN